ncbi:hypothetical protein V2H21_06515 [Riemerella anatipestifer]|uniref:hypothetical protein n=1 Tax=Riemerella anatipestifer TaxID=34085 RepID=UPI002EADBCC0|nr:hypothetical protein [Riemerella anatipestifer]
MTTKTTKLSVLAFLGLSLAAYGQYDGKVGINTTTPNATLELQISDANKNGSTKEGILIPSVTAARAKAMGTDVKESTLVYIESGVAEANTTISEIRGKGFYYFTNGKWVSLSITQANDQIWTNDPTTGVVKIKNLFDGTTERTDDNNVFVNNDGFVGVGENNPTRAIFVKGDNYSNGSIAIERNYSSVNAAPTLEFNKTRGTGVAKKPVGNNDYLGNLLFRGYDGANYVNTSSIGSKVNGDVVAGEAIKSDITFSTTNDLETERSVKMTLNKDGKLGIGMSSAPLYSLSVSTPHTGINYATTDGIFLLNKLTNREKAGIRSIGGVEIASDFEGNFPSVGEITFKVSNQEHMRVASGGKVGIGTIAPTNKLHIKADTDPVKIEGLQTSTVATDKVVVADTNGILKTVERSSFSGGNTLNAITGSIRKVDQANDTEWKKEGTFCLIQTTTETIDMPNPANYAGKILSVNNQSGTQLNYGGSYQPISATTLDGGKGHILMSDGSAWYVIGGSY